MVIVLTIFIPITILWMIPIIWLQWLLTILSSLISGSVLIVTFWPTIYSERKTIKCIINVNYFHSTFINGNLYNVSFFSYI